MLGKLKAGASQANELRKLRGEAKKMQDELAQITESVHRGDIHVKVSADQKVQYIAVDGERQEEIEEALNEAFKEVQKKAAKKMMEMGGGLSSLLGGGS
jgi:DNA-binding protein YbaB